MNVNFSLNLFFFFFEYPIKKWYQRSTGMQICRGMNRRAWKVRHAAGQCQGVYNTVYQGSCNTTCPVQCPTNDGNHRVWSHLRGCLQSSQNRAIIHWARHYRKCYLIALLICPAICSSNSANINSGCCLIILNWPLQSSLLWSSFLTLTTLYLINHLKLKTSILKSLTSFFKRIKTKI